MWNDPFNHFHHVINQHGWGGTAFPPAQPAQAPGLGFGFGSSASA
ncbi:hypothetical protein [Speluncibacter jeojiensis]|uniref:Uncharacterized protein n=1 Tax=Speluncibacter jeojiensis TaxID=2710754 RepID=A0A9X4M2N2_9ACTN|nr:hypothetical protein [Rhodococcus sp. D2-41]MDG3016933.1 hypothetical protein [Corynebacteriales bacterium D3-21]